MPDWCSSFERVRLGAVFRGDANRVFSLYTWRGNLPVLLAVTSKWSASGEEIDTLIQKLY
jgi:hypothetical protein